MDNNSIEYLLNYYEKDIESCVIKIKNNKESINSNIKVLIKKLNKIETKELLIDVLNSFFNKRKKYAQYKDCIIDYISKNYDNNTINDNINSFIIEFNKFKKNILLNTKLNREYIILYSNYYWSNYSFKNNISKDELIEIAKKNNCDNNDILLLEKTLKFEKIKNKEELFNFENELNEYNDIISLKPFIENWRAIKTNQINNSKLPQETKIKYFKELEEDFANLIIYFDSNYQDLKKLLSKIDSRNYINEFIINYIPNKDIKTINNSLKNELLNIKKYQQITNKEKKY